VIEEFGEMKDDLKPNSDAIGDYAQNFLAKALKTLPTAPSPLCQICTLYYQSEQSHARLAQISRLILLTLLAASVENPDSFGISTEYAKKKGKKNLQVLSEVIRNIAIESADAKVLQYTAKQFETVCNGISEWLTRGPTNDNLRPILSTPLVLEEKLMVVFERVTEKIPALTQRLSSIESTMLSTFRLSDVVDAIMVGGVNLVGSGKLEGKERPVSSIF